MELHLVGSISADGISALSAVAKGLPRKAQLRREGNHCHLRAPFTVCNA